MNGKEILEALLQDIVSCVFSEASKLPSEAALCTRFGVARMTVRNALAELQRRGLIETRKGAGTFLTRRALRKSGVIGSQWWGYHRRLPRTLPPRFPIRTSSSSSSPSFARPTCAMKSRKNA